MSGPSPAGPKPLIWIDLDHSPHVLFFAPIIRELEKAGAPVLITVRDYAQTAELAVQHGLKATVIGKHSGSASSVRKLTNLYSRAWQLRAFAQDKGIDLAISHGSRTMVLAAKSLGIPVITCYDYEHISSRFFHWFSEKICVPQVIPAEFWKQQGVDTAQLIQYSGLKEELYVYGFRPDEKVLQEAGVRAGERFVVVRPPAELAHYHTELGAQLFDALLKRLVREPGIKSIVLARTAEQSERLQGQYGVVGANMVFRHKALDALSLMSYAAAVFSGGGTMVREAALLGLNVWTVFGGRMGAADEHLIAKGRLKALRTPAEIAAVVIPQQPAVLTEQPDPGLAVFLAQQFLSVARKQPFPSLVI